MSMLYPELFRSLERARWSLADDVPWDRFDPAALSEDQALTELRAKLPPSTALWVGGLAAGLQRRPIPGVQQVESVGDIGAQLRAARALAA